MSLGAVAFSTDIGMGCMLCGRCDIGEPGNHSLSNAALPSRELGVGERRAPTRPWIGQKYLTHPSLVSTLDPNTTDNAVELLPSRSRFIGKVRSTD